MDANDNDCPETLKTPIFPDILGDRILAILACIEQDARETPFIPKPSYWD